MIKDSRELLKRILEEGIEVGIKNRGKDKYKICMEYKQHEICSFESPFFMGHQNIKKDFIDSMVYYTSSNSEGRQNILEKIISIDGVVQPVEMVWSR